MRIQGPPTLEAVRKTMTADARWQAAMAPYRHELPPLAELVSIREARALTGISRTTIRRWARQGKIRRWGRPRCYRVYLAELLPEVNAKTTSDG